MAGVPHEDERPTYRNDRNDPLPRHPGFGGTFYPSGSLIKNDREARDAAGFGGTFDPGRERDQFQIEFDDPYREHVPPDIRNDDILELERRMLTFDTIEPPPTEPGGHQHDPIPWSPPNATSTSSTPEPPTNDPRSGPYAAEARLPRSAESLQAVGAMEALYAEELSTTVDAVSNTATAATALPIDNSEMMDTTDAFANDDADMRDTITNDKAELAAIMGSIGILTKLAMKSRNSGGQPTADEIDRRIRRAPGRGAGSQTQAPGTGGRGGFVSPADKFIRPRPRRPKRQIERGFHRRFNTRIWESAYINRKEEDANLNPNNPVPQHG